MSNQAENENQQTVTPEEVRQYMLAELDASKETIAELSDEELEEVAGGIGLTLGAGGLRAGLRGAFNNARPAFTNAFKEIKGALKDGWTIGKKYGN